MLFGKLNSKYYDACFSFFFSFFLTFFLSFDFHRFSPSSIYESPFSFSDVLIRGSDFTMPHVIP